MNIRNRPPPTFRRRVNSQMMRWQARLEAGWADRYIPWIAAAVLAVLYFTLAEAQIQKLYQALDDDLTAKRGDENRVSHLSHAKLTDEQILQLMKEINEMTLSILTLRGLRRVFMGRKEGG